MKMKTETEKRELRDERFGASARVDNESEG